MTSLFCYGTLCEPRILSAIIGKTLPTSEAKLINYACLRVRGAAYPGLKKQHDATTTGVIYQEVTTQDLRKLDEYEGDEYERVQLAATDFTFSNLKEKDKTWVYSVQRKLATTNCALMGMRRHATHSAPTPPSTSPARVTHLLCRSRT